MESDAYAFNAGAIITQELFALTESTVNPWEEKYMQAANDNAILVSMAVACGMTSLSRSAINIARARGMFPAAVPLGEKRIAFVRSEIEVWINGRIAARAA